MKTKEELKQLFENGDKPTQEDFWEWQNSYWHKDEKLPTEAEGIYKIKGSIVDLAALNAITGMSEGDVYNVLATGDNYVYVLDLNNTGNPGWDKLSGTVDLSNVVMKTGDQNINGVKNFIGGVTQFLKDNDDITNANGFIQSAVGGLSLGTINNKDFSIFRNQALKLFIGNDYSTFVNRLKIPNATESNDAMTYGQMLQTGLWQTSLYIETDLNGIDRTCFARVDNTTANAPFNYGTVITHVHEAGARSQIGVDITNGEMWSRAKTSGGNYSSWKKSGEGNFLPLSGGVLTGGGEIESNGSLYLKPFTEGGNATGIWWKNKNGSGDFAAGFGSLTQDGDIVHQYVGWGPAPWVATNCLLVNPENLKYKNKNIWREDYLKATSSDANNSIDIDIEGGYTSINFNDGVENSTSFNHNCDAINLQASDSDQNTIVSVTKDNISLERHKSPDADNIGSTNTIKLESDGKLELSTSYNDEEGKPNLKQLKTTHDVVRDEVVHTIIDPDDERDIVHFRFNRNTGLSSTSDFATLGDPNLSYAQKLYVKMLMNQLINQINEGVSPIPNLPGF